MKIQIPVISIKSMELGKKYTFDSLPFLNKGITVQDIVFESTTTHRRASENIVKRLKKSVDYHFDKGDMNAWFTLQESELKQLIKDKQVFLS